jgi:DNA polymerase III delta prime subunit
MLMEKYRPVKFEDFIGQTEIVNQMKSQIKEGGLQHQLFFGPSGVGKTTLALIVARELYGETWRQSFFEFNASTDRGIDVVRNKIIELAKRGAVSSDYKIIFLDEADSLTKDAQHALRRIMEEFYKQTRFIISCNFVEKIIEPIKSRCVVNNFRPFGAAEVAQFLNRVNQNEGMKLAGIDLEKIAHISRGDLRRATNYYEKVVCGGSIPTFEGDNLLDKSLGELMELSYKLDPDMMLSRIHEEIVAKKDFAGLIKVADADYRMALGTNKIIQIQNCLVRLKT